MEPRIYLDGHASTPLAAAARDAMISAWSHPGNPHSHHFAGIEAAALVEEGRADLAALLGCSPVDLVFTSGATEANNIAIIGCARAALHSASPRRELLVSAIEHKSVLAAAEALVPLGFKVRLLPVDRSGAVDLPILDSLLSDRTLLLSTGGANGEIGVVQDLAPIIAAARRAGALVHSDLAQLAGKLPVDVVDLDLDYASISAHKMQGPQGIGALYVSPLALRPAPLAFGGGQERGLRPGTIPAPLAAGFGAAARLTKDALNANGERARQLATRFLDELSQRQVRWKLNGNPDRRIPGSLSLQIMGTDADSLIERISNKIAISTGSACQSGEIHPSHVLRAIHLDEEEQRSTLRILFGSYHRDEDPVNAARLIAAAAVQEQLVAGADIQ